jgi:hypothetical protein
MSQIENVHYGCGNLSFHNHISEQTEFFWSKAPQVNRSVHLRREGRGTDQEV